ncbi:MAG: hypothetical protein U9R24_06075 [Thermodesulfobacteriota bacterium]|nr:hypothetical protein [Thermodesulfobacteriota bacterium]
MKKIAAVMLALLIVLSAHSVFAGYIRLDTEVTSVVEKGGLKVSISLKNRGNEPAYNLQGEIETGDKRTSIKKKKELAVNESYRVESLLGLDPVKPGTYPLTVTVYYTDINQHPFSAVTCTIFVYEKETLPLIFGQIEPVTFSRKAALTLRLNNLDETGLKTSTRLVVPREVTTEGETKECLVPARGASSLLFHVKNFGALPGSTYPVFCVTQFERGGRHHTAISRGSISISEWDFFKEYRNYIFALVIILLFFFIVLQIVLQFVKKGSKT